jgi:hypothetical protein
VKKRKKKSRAGEYLGSAQRRGARVSPPTPKPEEPFVNVVVVDNNVPGGFRYEQRPTDAARTNR